MHPDEYRAGFERPRDHRTRTNRHVAHPDPTGPYLVQIDPGNQATVRPARQPLTDHEIEQLADRIIERLHCQHQAVRESLIAGRATNRECIDCGDALPDRDWEDQ